MNKDNNTQFQKTNQISVVIPAYNEELGIEEVLVRVHQVLKGKCEYEIIVVDDGSKDKTGEIATKNNATVFVNPINIGYGFSLKRGIRKAKYECVIITDADGTYPIEDIPKLIKEYDRGFDMVVGARQGRAYITSFTKKIARACFKWMSEFVVGRTIADINSGFRAIRRSKALPILEDLSNRFSFTTSITLIFFLKHHFVMYIPIAYEVRKGKSKVKYVRDALIATQIMVDIIAKYNPIKLFLFLSFFPALVGTIFLVTSLMLLQTSFLEMAVILWSVALLLLSFGFFAAIFRKT